GRARYRNLTDRAAPVGGEADRIAAFSSAGPTIDGRIKPDLCAPGTNMPAPRSQVSQARGWGLADPLPYYMFEGGTSSAAGVAAVVRQQWRKARGGVAPSGAALKAILVTGARPVRGRGTNPVASPFEAGHGRVSVSGSLPDRVRLLADGDAVTTGDTRDYP